MRVVLVCGGRDFSDWALLSATLDRLHAEKTFNKVITGAAPGADTLADTWARSRGIKVERYYALWRTYGNAAGPMRSQQMLDREQPHLVVAFPGGRGTLDMITKAQAAGVPVEMVRHK